MNIENNKFHYYLNNFSSNTTDILCPEGCAGWEKKQIIFEKAKKGKAGVSPTAIMPLLAYINDHMHHLQKSDLKTLRILHEKISAAVNDKTVLLSVNGEFLKFCEKVNGTKTEVEEKSDIEVTHRIASPPKTDEELVHNLRLIREFYPRYILDYDLAVYDRSFKSFPLNSDIGMIRSKLEKLAFCENNPKGLMEVLFNVADLHIQKKVISAMILVQETSCEDKGANKEDFCAVSEKNIPIVFTRPFLEQYQACIESHFETHDLYMQTKGCFVLLLEKGKSPEEFGFGNEFLDGCKDFVQWKERSLDTLPKVHKVNDKEILESLSDIFSRSGDFEFYRVIDLKGHGLNGNSIASVGIFSFSSFLKILSENHVQVLYIDSCYAAGQNMDFICLADKSIPIPIIIRGVTDYVTYSGEKSSLPLAQNLLEKRMKEAKGHPFALSKHDIHSISGSKNMSIVEHSVSTVLLPTNAEDLRIREVSRNAIYLQDMRKCFQEETYRISGSKLVIKSPSVFTWKYKNDFIFSDPVTRGKLIIHSPKSKALISMGGSTHHFIQEIEMPYRHFEILLEETFNAFRSLEQIENHKEPAFKAFAIAKMTCLYEGKRRELRNVVIAIGPKERKAIFSLPPELNSTPSEYRVLEFEEIQEKGERIKFWRQASKEKTVKVPDAILQMYSIFAASQPVKLSRFQKEQELQFYEAIHEHFWCHRPPLPVFSHSIIHDTEK